MALLRGKISHCEVACAITVVVAVAFLCNYLFFWQVNPWVLVTAPLTPLYSTNAVIGYSWLLNGDVTHKENMSPLYNSLIFYGFPSTPDGYYLRSVYPYLVSISSWVLELKASALFVNYLAYATIVVVTGLFAFELTLRRAVACAAGGSAAVTTGVIVHLNDLSAHMVGNAVFALVTLAVFRSNVWRERRPTIVHLRIGLLLFIGHLAYPNGLVLTAAYGATAIGRSRWWDVALGMGCGIIAGPIWLHVLDVAYSNFFGLHNRALFQDDFGRVLQESLSGWIGVFHSGPVPFLGAVARPLIDSLFVGFPPLVLAGAVAIFLVHRHDLRRLWFFVVFFSVTYIGPVLFSMSVLARGYIAFASMPLLVASLATALLERVPIELHSFRHPRESGGPEDRTPALDSRFRGNDDSRRSKPALVVPRAIPWAKVRFSLFVVLAIGQGCWSISYMFGYFFPIESYFVGWYASPAPNVSAKVMNLTGNQPLWRFFGGPADFVSAGGLPLGRFTTLNSSQRSFPFALLLNGIMLLPVVGLLATYRWTWLQRLRMSVSRCLGMGKFNWSAGLVSSLVWCVAWAGCAILTASLGYAEKHQTIEPFSTDVASRYPGVSDFKYEIELAKPVVEELSKLHKQYPLAELQIFIRATGLRGIKVFCGDQDLDAHIIEEPDNTMTLWKVDAGAFLSGARKLVLQGHMVDGSFGGWQAGPIPRRTVEPDARTRDNILFLPSLELRLVDVQRNSVLFLAY